MGDEWEVPGDDDERGRARILILVLRIASPEEDTAQLVASVAPTSRLLLWGAPDWIGVRGAK
jgi:hypothetical protein